MNYSNFPFSQMLLKFVHKQVLEISLEVFPKLCLGIELKVEFTN